MYKLLLLIVFLSGCATTEDMEKLRLNTGASLDVLTYQIARVDYFIEHDKCFITYSICLGEEKTTKKECWDRHEQCVISVYRKWKSLKQE
jgi:hypothetical protein